MDPRTWGAVLSVPARSAGEGRQVSARPCPPQPAQRTAAAVTAPMISRVTAPNYGWLQLTGPPPAAEIDSPADRPERRPRRFEGRGRDAHQTCDTARQPPVPAAEEGHQRRDEKDADDRRVDEDRHREAEAELLQADHAARDEARERGDHDDRGRAHDPAGALEPEPDRAHVVVGLVPGLAHARDQEDLVVHGEAEEHREEEDRDPRLDL